MFKVPFNDNGSPRVYNKFIEDTFFGGAEKDAAKKQQQGIEAGQDFIRQGTAQARGDIQNIFPSIQQLLQQGYQGASNIFGQALPQQADTFQAGNMAAQQQIAQGMPQFQNAILGGQVDYSQFQPTQLQQPDFGFLQNQQFEVNNPFAVPIPDPATVGPQPQGQRWNNQQIHPLSGNFNNGRRN